MAWRQAVNANAVTYGFSELARHDDVRKLSRAVGGVVPRGWQPPGLLAVRACTECWSQSPRSELH
jgi:hypothetical protein